MKLRLRSFETKETLKLDIPNPCTLQHLKQLVCQKLPFSSISQSLHLSLNQKDELTTTSPQDSIQSIGITSGDLIFFTTNPNGFLTNLVTPTQPTFAKSQTPKNLIPSSGKQDEAININTSSEKVNTVDIDNSNPSSEEIMEIDDDVASVTEVDKSFSVPSFLRKVFSDELGDDDGLNHKLLVIAVRAVLFESGFVEVGPASNDSKMNLYLASFYYTLPNIITNGNIETVKIKFQSFGKYCTVYGSLVNGTGTHSVMLDEEKLVPLLNVVWANCGLVVSTVEENNKVLSIEPEKEVFEFWKKIKDGLALPLLIDLCEKVGFELPPCFMRLPTELKLKILESVSGVDIAKVSCTCSELRYLGSSDDLWKQKYIEQFGDMGGSDARRTYKERFVKTWEGRKRRKIAAAAAARLRMSMMRRNCCGPFGVGQFPGMIGGDYELFPNLGPFGLPRGGGPRMRNVMPNSMANPGFKHKRGLRNKWIL